MTLQQLRSDALAVTDTTVDSLRKNDAFDMGDFNVFVDIQILHNECQRQYPINEFLEKGGVSVGRVSTLDPSLSYANVL